MVVDKAKSRVGAERDHEHEHEDILGHAKSPLTQQSDHDYDHDRSEADQSNIISTILRYFNLT